MKKRISVFILALAFVAGAFFMPANVQAQTVYNGVDIYEYSNISDYQQLKNSGISVVIQKASEGVTYNDSLLNYRASMLPQYGFKVGYYHFATNNGQPVAQAQHFLDRIKGLHNDTVLWLDIENQPNWTKAQAIDFTNKFIGYVQDRGYKIGIYTGLSFYYEYLSGNIGNVPLWLASYGKQPLQFPNKVSWQYTATGGVPGMVGNVDRDYFNDSIFGGNVPSIPSVQVKPTANTDVKQIQHNLNRIMNSKLIEDGIQGPQTTQAITSFQSIMGITVDGIAGDRTKTAINQILDFIPCQYGSDNFATKYVQYRLHIHVDGKFGVQTRNAVMNYQRTHGLAVNGVTYTSFWKCLFR